MIGRPESFRAAVALALAVIPVGVDAQDTELAQLYALS